MEKLTLYGRPGWGSVLIETQLVWYDIPFEFHGVGDLFTDADARQALEKINPLAQIPTLVLPDGSVMTESAAITLWLADQSHSHSLVPASTISQQSQFLRWLIFITSNIYPTYTYADEPSRFVPDASAQSGFAECVNQYAKKLYTILDEAASSPWFLGDRFSALDIYICAMSHWSHPGPAWFRDHTSNLVAIAKETKALPKLSEIWMRNFPETDGGN